MVDRVFTFWFFFLFRFIFVLISFVLFLFFLGGFEKSLIGGFKDGPNTSSQVGTIFKWCYFEFKGYLNRDHVLDKELPSPNLLL